MVLLKELLIATRNKGKTAEFSTLFAPLGIQVKSLDDYKDAPDIIEDGATFADNALKKAMTIAEMYRIPTLADDSGLCVDKLNGAPGVYSARYAGEHASDRDNNIKLLRELSGLPSARKTDDTNGGSDSSTSGKVEDPHILSTARFVCVLVLYNPHSQQKMEVEGVCEGYIIDEPRGEGGFGYDPLFYIPETGLTMAQLSIEQKNELSHRGHALRALLSRMNA